MSVTYAPCAACGKLNRVILSETAAKEPLCGNCKSSLPLHFGVVELNAVGLAKLIAKSPLPVVCDFWAAWCGPCKMFAPIFQQTAGRFAGRAVFAKLDTEKNPAAGASHQVKSIPTIIFFREGKETQRLNGALGADDFSRWLAEAL